MPHMSKVMSGEGVMDEKKAKQNHALGVLWEPGQLPRTSSFETPISIPLFDKGGENFPEREWKDA